MFYEREIEIKSGNNQFNGRDNQCSNISYFLIWYVVRNTAVGFFSIIYAIVNIIASKSKTNH